VHVEAGSLSHYLLNYILITEAQSILLRRVDSELFEKGPKPWAVDIQEPAGFFAHLRKVCTVFGES
jgi:hypothetical protein